VLDYTWAPTLDDGDTLASILVAKVSGDVVIDSQSQVGGQCVLWLSGGTAGETNEFYGRAITAAGRTYETTIYLQIVESNATSPWVGQFFAAFPAFSGVPIASISFWKTEADRVLLPLLADLGDRADLCAMLVTAHYLVQNGLGTGAESEIAAQGATGFTRVKSGTLELERGKNDAAAKMGDWGTTSYGMRVYPMLKACAGGPRVTGTGSLCVTPPPYWN
jgi:hypothetical protein